MHERGTLIAIGGHEDKEGDRTILKEVAKRLEARSSRQAPRRIRLRD